ncbi:MAG TPA: hypothetical protein PLF26_02165 [Blastocatellia bacterium]|nr:hypothetical protein [Blastocatellia bacterium]
MWRRGSLGIGLALCLCGAVFALAPTTTALFSWVSRFWPVLPILIGAGSLAGFALKRQPRSPWAGALLLILGGLALAATLQSAMNPLALYGRYWPILLGVVGLVEVLRHYTKRAELGERPALLSFGKVALVGMIVASGFAANRLAEANPNIIANIAMPSGLGKLRDNLFGNEFVFDKVTQQATLPASGTVTIANRFGAVTIEGVDGDTVTVELTPKVRAYDKAAADKVVGSLQMSVAASASGVSVGTNRNEIDHQIETDMRISVPRGAAISLSQAHGNIVIADVASTTGGVDIESTHSDITMHDVKSAVTIKNDSGKVAVTRSSGSLSINGRNDIAASIYDGAIRIEDADSVELKTIVSRSIDLVSVDSATVTIDTVAPPVDAQLARVSVAGERTGVKVKNIRGDVTIHTSHDSVEAIDITGTLSVEASHTDVNALRVGALTVKTDHDDVKAREVAGAVDIENDHGEVLVNDFSGDCRVKTSFDPVRLSAAARHDGDVEVSNEHGDIDVRLPAGQNYDIRPEEAGHGTVRIDPAFAQAASAASTQRRVSLKTSYADITVRPGASRPDGPDPA